MWSHIFLFDSLPSRRPPEFTAILMFEFWRDATAASVPGLLCQSGRVAPKTGTLRSEDDDSRENVAEKVNSRSFNLPRDYSKSLTLSNVGEPF